MKKKIHILTGQYNNSDSPKHFHPTEDFFPMFCWLKFAKVGENNSHCSRDAKKRYFLLNYWQNFWNIFLQKCTYANPFKKRKAKKIQKYWTKDDNTPTIPSINKVAINTIFRPFVSAKHPHMYDPITIPKNNYF